MVSIFPQVSKIAETRMILRAIAKAMKAMSSILVLLGLFMWMFAIIGEILFTELVIKLYYITHILKVVNCHFK